MCGMFYNCSSLQYLPDISKWNIDNVTNIALMFFNCSSLLSFPDISKWNTTNIVEIDGIFAKCALLPSLHNFSRWNINILINQGKSLTDIYPPSFIDYNITYIK